MNILILIIIIIIIILLIGCIFFLYKIKTRITEQLNSNNDKYKIKTRINEQLNCNDITEKDDKKFIEIEYETPKNIMDTNTKNKYYQLLQSIHKILVSNNIPYALCAGTLLGSYRHQEVIPYDDDADICIKFEDNSRLMSLQKEFKKEGITLGNGCLSCWSEFYKDVCEYCNLQADRKHPDFVPTNMEQPCKATPYFATFSKGDIHCDIFHVIPITDDTTKRTMYSIYGNNRLISQSQYDNLFNTISCDLGPAMLRCPRNTKELLCYHYDNINIPTKEQMENKDKNPSMWNGKNKDKSHFEILNGKVNINNFK